MLYQFKHVGEVRCLVVVLDKIFIYKSQVCKIKAVWTNSRTIGIKWGVK